MKHLITYALFLVSILCLFEKSEGSALNLYSPSELESNQACISVRHRFFGSAYSLENFFGMDEGANTYLGFRYQAMTAFELKASYTRTNKEKPLGISYRFSAKPFPVTAQIDLDYIAFQNSALTEKNRRNIFITLSMQNEPIFDRLSGIVDLAYDGYFKRFICAPGTIITLRKNPTIFRDVSAIIEYYPVLDRHSAGKQLSQYILATDSYFLGIRLKTYGHCFLFSLSNATDFHPRRLSLGTAASGEWRLGFNIERILYL